MINNDRFDLNAEHSEPDLPRQRFESDRESLPFPIGGVFGPLREGEPEEGVVWDTNDVVNAIERTIDRMQDQLNELETDVESVIAHIGREGDPFRPSAA